MTKPADADELREFLGIATNMSQFIPKLSANTGTLRDQERCTICLELVT